MKILFDFHNTLAYYPQEGDAADNPKELRLFPETKLALEYICNLGCEMGVVSNWSVELVADLKDLGIRDFFKTAFASEMPAIQCEKPDSFIFTRAMEVMDSEARPSDFIYIGDNYVTDYVGAVGVGMRAVLIDRDGWRRKKYPHTYCVGSLLDLDKVIDNIGVQRMIPGGYVQTGNQGGYGGLGYGSG